MDDRLQSALNHAIGAGEMGIQAAAFLQDELIIDEWIGVADPTAGREVTGDTLFIPYSVTKAVVAVALHIQAERGLVEYEAPVTRYWKEYGANGKEKTTVRDALTHRAGVPQMPDNVTPELMCDWDWMVEQIAKFEPMYPPGTTNAYHCLVWGWIIGEVVRRTDPDRRDLGQFIRQEICEPLDIQDLYLGSLSRSSSSVSKSITKYRASNASGGISFGTRAQST
jgi:CubicO group peptidase (beta-lactamase class C family)